MRIICLLNEVFITPCICVHIKSASSGRERIAQNSCNRGQSDSHIQDGDINVP